MAGSSAPQPDPAPPTSTRRGGWVFGTGVLLLVVTSTVGALHGCALHPTQGTVTASGPDLGNWTMHVNTCHSGAGRGFHGAQLYDSHDKRLAVWMVEDPLRGLVASVNSTTEDSAINLGRADCQVLRGGVRASSTRVNYQTVMKGSWDLDCAWPGNHVSGHIDSSHCL